MEGRYACKISINNGVYIQKRRPGRKGDDVSMMLFLHAGGGQFFPVSIIHSIQDDLCVFLC